MSHVVKIDVIVQKVYQGKLLSDDERHELRHRAAEGDLTACEALAKYALHNVRRLAS